MWATGDYIREIYFRQSNITDHTVTSCTIGIKICPCTYRACTQMYLRQQHCRNITGYRGTRFQRGYGLGGLFRSLARYAIPPFKQGAKVVGKRALQAATEVGLDVLEGKKVSRSIKSRRGEAVKDFAEQGERTLMRQTGHGSKRRRGQRSNLSFVKKQKLEDPRLTKWITDDKSSHDEESDCEMSQTGDDIY